MTIGPVVFKIFNPKHLKIVRKRIFGKTAFKNKNIKLREVQHDKIITIIEDHNFTSI